MSDHQTAPAHPAATVILLRDGEEECEVLLVRRNAQLAFHGGAWVFPGGRVDPEDCAAGESADVLASAKRAAVREAREEAGVAISAGDLILLSRWITPVVLAKRFDTWFFAARTSAHAVEIDGGEIHEFRWMSPERAVAAQGSGEIELPPPTFVTLLNMAGYRRAADILAQVAKQTPETFLPRLCPVPGGACTLYHGDAAYDDGDIDKPGPRHRLVMLESGWRYERSD